MIFQPAIERKLSALVGAEVKFDQFKVSLFAGRIEVTGVKIGDFLTATRGVASVAIARALKGEIIVTSITIERPVMHLANLRKRTPGQLSTAPAADEAEKASWTFDIEKTLIVDGQIHLSPKLTIDKMRLELKRTADGYAATLLADRVAESGRLQGQLEFKGNLTFAQLLALL